MINAHVEPHVDQRHTWPYPMQKPDSDDDDDDDDSDDDSDDDDDDDDDDSDEEVGCEALSPSLQLASPCLIFG